MKSNSTLQNSSTPGGKSIAAATNLISMEPSTNPASTTQLTVDRFAEYPELTRLRLATGDLDELRKQGFLSMERRGNLTVHKLRFRRGGRQVARSIGDAAKAAAVKTELDSLQSRRQICREVATFDRAARRLLRDMKTQLEPLVIAYGWKFHGRVVRQPHPVK
jgi:hypothetical protein